MKNNLRKLVTKSNIVDFKIYSYYLKIKSYIKYYFFIPRKLRKNFKERIKIISNIKDLNKHKKLFIFVSFAEKLSTSSICLLETIKESGYGIIHVNNRKTSKGDIEYLINNNFFVIDRTNIGRDFGAYKDIFLFLDHNGIIRNLDYLGFVNDSTQFIPGRNADRLKKEILNFEKTNSSGLFTHQSFQVESHYQSFFKILKNDIFNTKSYKNFWRRYKSLDYKQHLIHNGEIALSSLFYNSIKNPSILYSTNKLAKSILPNAIDNFESETKNTSIKSCFPSIESKLLKGTINDLQRNEFLKSADISLEDISSHKDLQFSLFEIIENSNPSHVAAFLYPLFLGCPFLKKDLALAGSYSLGQSSKLYQLCLSNSLDLIKEEDKQLFNELSYEYDQLLSKKGNPYSYINKKLEYYKLGLN